MRKRTFSLLLPLLLAACGSTAGSPSAATPGVATPTAVAVSPSPSASAPSAPPVAPSEAPASVDPGAAFREDTLQPILDEITTSLTRWADAAAAAAAPDADRTDTVTLAGAAFRVRTALASGTALLEQADVPECATEVRAQAATFIDDLSQSSADLLADDSANADEVNAVLQQASEAIPTLTDALQLACA